MKWRTTATGVFCETCGAQLPIQTLVGIPYATDCWACYWARLRRRTDPPP